MDFQVQNGDHGMVSQLTVKGAATRERIVAGAAEVIRENGIDITLDDIRAHTRTSKSQIFHYFPDGREELLLAVARHEAHRVIEEQQPYLGQLTTWAEWIDWRDAVIARYERQGVHCPLSTLTWHLGSTTEGARDIVRRLMLNWVRPLREGIEAMQRNGETDPAIDSAAYARAIVASVQGGVQILMATGSTQHLVDTLDLALSNLRTGPAAADL
ncbi:TetR/AcrR family transcriptional regulator [Aeromicrobium sp. UC242_57]|uniref:TetR/AcrR family transcriptional regulator n=1 Tax=Aeromicrobium sp. UC242_57 TaxID=3374624 RepID=UPI0037B5AAFA